LQDSQTIPKPAQVIGRLLNEYHRSLSVTSIDKAGSKKSDNSKKRNTRGKSVEPLETKRTHSLSIKRSSSLRQDTPKGGSKLMNLLTRRKASSPTSPELSQLETCQHSKPPRTHSSVAIFTAPPKVTSPHPVRRNKATVYPKWLLGKKRSKNEVRVPPRPRTMQKKEPEKQGAVEKKVPPPKPPRTLSTFFTSSDQEALFKKLLDSGEVKDAKVKLEMSTEIKTIESPKAKPRSRLRTGDYDRVIRNFEGVKTAPTLPLGHAGEYAELSVSGESASSIGAGYNCLKRQKTEEESGTSERPSIQSTQSEPQLPIPKPRPPLNSTHSHPHLHTAPKISPYYSVPCISPEEDQIQERSKKFNFSNYALIQAKITLI